MSHTVRPFFFVSKSLPFFLELNIGLIGRIRTPRESLNRCLCCWTKAFLVNRSNSSCNFDILGKTGHSWIRLFWRFPYFFAPAPMLTVTDEKTKKKRVSIDVTVNDHALKFSVPQCPSLLTFRISNTQGHRTFNGDGSVFRDATSCHDARASAQRCERHWYWTKNDLSASCLRFFNFGAVFELEFFRR